MIQGGVPFGKLVSFGVVEFPNMSTPLTDFDVQWQGSFSMLPDQAFPADLYGEGPAPLVNPSGTWTYLIQANVDPDDWQQAYPQVEDQYNTIYTQLRRQQVAQLTVEDARKVSHSCKARILKAPLKLKPGANTMYYMADLTWAFLSDWN